jgi:hypothetical protein
MESHNGPWSWIVGHVKSMRVITNAYNILARKPDRKQPIENQEYMKGH